MTEKDEFNLRTFRELPLLRNSERGDFNTCPAKWNWRWNLGLIPATPRQDARYFGSLWHLLWAKVYTPPAGSDGFTRSITNPAEIHQLWDEISKNAYSTVSSAKYFDDESERAYWDLVELGHIMIDGQLRKWNLDPGYEVLMPEQRFRAKIPFNARQQKMGLRHWANLGFPRGAETGGFIAEIVGTLDLPVRDHTDGRGTIRILDWKTTARKDNLKQGNKDNQMGTYISVTTGFLRRDGLIKADEAVQGAILSFAKKTKPPENVDGNGTVRNKPRKEHYLDSLRHIGIDVPGMDKFKLEELAVLAKDAELVVWGDASKRQGSPLFWREIIVRNKANRLRQIARIADDVEEMTAVRSGVMPIRKSPGDHCNWCDFTDLCDVDEDGGDTEQFMEAVFKFDDPYADHQAGAINSKLLSGETR